MKRDIRLKYRRWEHPLACGFRRQTMKDLRCSMRVCLLLCLGAWGCESHTEYYDHSCELGKLRCEAGFSYTCQTDSYSGSRSWQVTSACVHGCDANHEVCKCPSNCPNQCDSAGVCQCSVPCVNGCGENGMCICSQACVNGCDIQGRCICP